MKNRSVWVLMLLGVLSLHVLGNFIFFKQGVFAYVFDENARIVNALFFNDLLFSAARGCKEKFDAIVHLSVPQGHSHLVEVFAAAVLEVLRQVRQVDIRWLIMGVNFVYAGILVISVYRIGKIVYGRPAGVLAGFLLLMFPFVFAHSRVLMLDFPLMAMVSLTVLMLLKTKHFSSWRHAVWLGMCASLAELTKETAVIFLVPPVMVYLVVSLFKGDTAKRLLNALLAAAVVGVMAGFIYFRPENRYAFSQYFALAKEANNPSGWFYILNLENYLGVYLVWLCCPWIVLALLRWSKRSAVLLMWFLVPLVIYSVVAAQYPRYLLPAFPALALMIAGEMMLVVRQEMLKYFMVGLVVMAALVQYVGYNAGVLGYTKKIKVPLVSYTVGRLAFKDEPNVVVGQKIFAALQAEGPEITQRAVMGSLAFLAGEFNGDVHKAQALMGVIVTDAGIMMPRFVDIQAVVDWLNNAQEPFVLYFKAEEGHQLRVEQKSVVESVMRTFSPGSRKLMEQRQWAVLGSMPEGQLLKRKILEVLYPAQTPQKHVVLFLFNMPEIYGTVRLQCFLGKMNYDVVCPTEMYEAGLVLWPWRGDRDEVLRADYVVVKSGATPRNFSKDIQGIEDRLKDGLDHHKNAFGKMVQVPLADNSYVEVYKKLKP
ncbi:MAG: glycosyltransferase family 39 protein [Candidatus Omnitrophota bacterium]